MTEHGSVYVKSQNVSRPVPILDIDGYSITVDDIIKIYWDEELNKFNALRSNSK